MVRLLTEWVDKDPFTGRPKSHCYIIFTGPRCHGFMSRKTYSSDKGAKKAGLAMMEKLGLRERKRVSHV